MTASVRTCSWPSTRIVSSPTRKVKVRPFHLLLRVLQHHLVAHEEHGLVRRRVGGARAPFARRCPCSISTGSPATSVSRSSPDAFRVRVAFGLFVRMSPCAMRDVARVDDLAPRRPRRPSRSPAPRGGRGASCPSAFGRGLSRVTDRAAGHEPPRLGRRLLEHEGVSPHLVLAGAEEGAPRVAGALALGRVGEAFGQDHRHRVLTAQEPLSAGRPCLRPPRVANLAPGLEVPAWPARSRSAWPCSSLPSASSRSSGSSCSTSDVRGLPRRRRGRPGPYARLRRTAPPARTRSSGCRPVSGSRTATRLPAVTVRAAPFGPLRGSAVTTASRCAWSSTRRPCSSNRKASTRAFTRRLSATSPGPGSTSRSASGEAVASLIVRSSRNQMSSLPALSTRGPLSFVAPVVPGQRCRPARAQLHVVHRHRPVGRGQLVVEVDVQSLRLQGVPALHDATSPTKRIIASSRLPSARRARISAGGPVSLLDAQEDVGQAARARPSRPGTRDPWRCPTAPCA